MPISTHYVRPVNEKWLSSRRTRGAMKSNFAILAAWILGWFLSSAFAFAAEAPAQPKPKDRIYLTLGVPAYFNDPETFDGVWTGGFTASVGFEKPLLSQATQGPDIKSSPWVLSAFVEAEGVGLEANQALVRQSNPDQYDALFADFMAGIKDEMLYENPVSPYARLGLGSSFRRIQDLREFDPFSGQIRNIPGQSVWSSLLCFDLGLDIRFVGGLLDRKSTRLNS